MNDYESTTPRYSCHIKAKGIKKTYNSPISPRYAFVVHLVFYDNVKRMYKSFVFGKDVGDLKISGHSTSTNYAYSVLRKALFWFIGKNMMNDEIAIYSDDPTMCKQIGIRTDGKKNQRISSLYDYAEIAEETKKILELFSNLKIHHVPQESCSIPELMLSSADGGIRLLKNYS